MENYIKNETLAVKPTTLVMLEDNYIDINNDCDSLNISISFSDASISEGESFLDNPDEHHFIGLGDATGNYAIYTVFVVDKTKKFEDQPIVAFGTEGEINLIAKDFNDFLRLLTLGKEVLLDYDELEGAYFSEPDYDDLDEDVMEELSDFRNALTNAGFELCEFETQNSYEFQRKIIMDAQIYKPELIETLRRIAPYVVMNRWNDIVI